MNKKTTAIISQVSYFLIVNNLILLIFTGSAFSQNTLGLLLNTEDAYNGYTLFGNNETTYLIDNCGDVINSWESNYKTGHGMYLLENGDLLRAGMKSGSFSGGGLGGIVELYNWEGQLEWSYTFADENIHAHHDLAPLPNGNFLACLWERRTEEDAKQNGRIYNGEVWSEKIIEVEMVGESQANIVWEWNVWDHLIQDINPSLSNYGVIADHPEMVDINYIGGDETSGNWLHMNAIDYNPMLDQIVVSSRLWSEIWVIDHSTTTGEGKTSSGGKYNKGGDLLYRYGNPQIYGQGDESERKLFGQHDIRWIPDSLSFGGMMMVFNNDYEEGVKSRIEIFQPPVQDDGSYYLESNNSYGPEEITWSYEQDGLHSDILSSAQMQPNGNVLICEGRTGHFIEASEEGNILWDYINPVNRNGGPGIDGSDPRMNMTWRAIKYSLDYKAFEGKDLIANGPVEVRPADYDCRLFPNSTTAITDVDNKQKSLRLKASIIDDFLQIESRINKNIAIDIIDLFGNKIKNFSVTPGDNSYPISEIIVGTYFLVYSDDNILRSIPFVKI